MSAAEGPALAVLRDREIEWDRPREAADAPARPPEALLRVAEAEGARRKRVVRGEGGFYMNRSVLPPGFRIPAHFHDYDELVVVLRGRLDIEGETTELGPDDAVVIRAKHRYAFTAGAEGVEFLTIRAGDAALSLAE